MFTMVALLVWGGEGGVTELSEGQRVSSVGKASYEHWSLDHQDLCREGVVSPICSSSVLMGDGRQE